MITLFDLSIYYPLQSQLILHFLSSCSRGLICYEKYIFGIFGRLDVQHFSNCVNMTKKDFLNPDIIIFGIYIGGVNI